MTFTDHYHTVEVTDVKPDPEFSGLLAIFHRSTHSYGATAVSHFISNYASIPENFALYVYLQVHYPEYCI